MVPTNRISISRAMIAVGTSPPRAHGDNAFPTFDTQQLANKSFCIPMNFEPIDMKVNHVRAEIVHEFPFTPFDAVLAAVLVCPAVPNLPFGLPGTRMVR